MVRGIVMLLVRLASLSSKAPQHHGKSHDGLCAVEDESVVVVCVAARVREEGDVLYVLELQRQAC